MAGLTVLVCPVGATKLSEYPEKPWRPEERQYAEPPSWEPADELSPLWCTEVGGRGCGLWTVLGCSDAAEDKPKNANHVLSSDIETLSTQLLGAF